MGSIFARILVAGRLKTVAMRTRRLRALSAHLVDLTLPAAGDSAEPLKVRPTHSGTPSSAEAPCSVAATTDLATLQAEFREHGFCILKDAINSAEVVRLRACALATAEKSSGWHVPLFPESAANSSTVGKHMWHVGGVLRHDQSFAPYIANEPLLQVLERVFDTPRSELLVTFTTLQVNRGGMDFGRGAGGWHSDGYLAQTRSYPAPQGCCQDPIKGHPRSNRTLLGPSMSGICPTRTQCMLQAAVRCLKGHGAHGCIAVVELCWFAVCLDASCRVCSCSLNCSRVCCRAVLMIINGCTWAAIKKRAACALWTVECGIARHQM